MTTLAPGNKRRREPAPSAADLEHPPHPAGRRHPVDRLHLLSGQVPVGQGPRVRVGAEEARPAGGQHLAAVDGRRWHGVDRHVPVAQAAPVALDLGAHGRVVPRAGHAAAVVEGQPDERPPQLAEVGLPPVCPKRAGEVALGVCSSAAGGPRPCHRGGGGARAQPVHRGCRGRLRASSRYQSSLSSLHPVAPAPRRSSNPPTQPERPRRNAMLAPAPTFHTGVGRPPLGGEPGRVVPPQGGSPGRSRRVLEGRAQASVSSDAGSDQARHGARAPRARRGAGDLGGPAGWGSASSSVKAISGVGRPDPGVAGHAQAGPSLEHVPDGRELRHEPLVRSSVGALSTTTISPGGAVCRASAHSARSSETGRPRGADDHRYGSPSTPVTPTTGSRSRAASGSRSARLPMPGFRPVCPAGPAASCRTRPGGAARGPRAAIARAASQRRRAGDGVCSGRCTSPSGRSRPPEHEHGRAGEGSVGPLLRRGGGSRSRLARDVARMWATRRCDRPYPRRGRPLPRGARRGEVEGHPVASEPRRRGPARLVLAPPATSRAIVDRSSGCSRAVLTRNAMKPVPQDRYCRRSVAWSRRCLWRTTAEGSYSIGQPARRRGRTCRCRRHQEASARCRAPRRSRPAPRAPTAGTPCCTRRRRCPPKGYSGLEGSEVAGWRSGSNPRRNPPRCSNRTWASGAELPGQDEPSAPAGIRFRRPTPA